MRGTVFLFVLGFACSVAGADCRRLEQGRDRGAGSNASSTASCLRRASRTDTARRSSLKDRMAHFHTPGVSIAVVNDGRIEWASGFGVKEWGKPDPVTDETIFQAGSISKPIFAMAVMRLVQDGKLDLDRDVNRYLKSWKVPANESWQPRVTLRQLLSHTAGLTVHGFPGYARSEKIPTVAEILDGRPPGQHRTRLREHPARQPVPIRGRRDHGGPAARRQCRGPALPPDSCRIWCSAPSA